MVAAMRESMNTRNILYEIYHKNITEDEAQAFFEEIFRKFHNNKLKLAPNLFLELSVAEWTAFVMHGMPFTILAQWRYHGWPAICAICDESFDFKQGSWRAFTELDVHGKKKMNVLTHWDCYSSSSSPNEAVIEIGNIHCCKMMTDFIKDPRVPIRYNYVFRGYYLIMNYSPAVQGIFYCPWCGVELPRDLRDDLFEILEKEYGLEPSAVFENDPLLPEEFKSDAWWKKRGL